MLYMGGKQKMAHLIVPILNNIAALEGIKNYYEPFCGGAAIAENMVDKIENIYCSDLREELIAFYHYIQDNGTDNLKHVSKQEFDAVKISWFEKDNKYPLWYYFWVGTMCSFRTRAFNSMEQDVDSVTSRKNSITLELKYINKIKYTINSYDNVDIKQNSIIYCDSPYIGTNLVYTRRVKENVFNFDKYYTWLKEKAQNNFILISEYRMDPTYFKPIQDFKYSKHFAINNNTLEEDKKEKYDKECIERLWVVRGGWLVDKYFNDKELDFDF